MAPQNLLQKDLLVSEHQLDQAVRSLPAPLLAHPLALEAMYHLSVAHLRGEVEEGPSAMIDLYVLSLQLGVRLLRFAHLLTLQRLLLQITQEAVLPSVALRYLHHHQSHQAHLRRFL